MDMGQLSILSVFWVGLGGFLGANARYLVGLCVEHFAPVWFNGRFFLSTLFVNVVGSFLLSAFYSWASARTALSEPSRQFIAIGFLGAFTTFSTFTLQVLKFQQEYGWSSMLISAIAHNAICLMAALAGWQLVNRTIS